MMFTRLPRVYPLHLMYLSFVHCLDQAAGLLRIEPPFVCIVFVYLQVWLAAQLYVFNPQHRLL